MPVPVPAAFCCCARRSSDSESSTLARCGVERGLGAETGEIGARHLIGDLIVRAFVVGLGRFDWRLWKPDSGGWC